MKLVHWPLNSEWAVTLGRGGVAENDGHENDGPEIDGPYSRA